MAEKKSRYRGVQPYQTSDQQLFFGREEDIENLHDFILLEKMVVLFGKSGYGKSSLLNAGIVPRLMDDKQPEAFRFRPIAVRFTDYDKKNSFSPLETLTRLIGAIPTDPAGDFLSAKGMEDSLWVQLKRRHQAGNGRFVLLFDQFEEFFSYPPAQQEAFRRQLAELLYTDIPQSLRLKQNDLSDEARRYLAQPMNIKAVFIIRSDRMSQLDSLKDTLPAILHKRYELRALTNSQARDAIVKPARIAAAQEFDSPPFEYTEDGLQAILDALGHQTPASGDHSSGIEAFQLQIICEYIESLVRSGSVPDLDGNGLPDVTRAQLPEMDTLYENYYHRKLGELESEDRGKARMVLEDLLLAEDAATGEGRRKSVDSLDLLGKGIAPGLLDALEKTYLLRQERNSVGGKSYEISHDTLLPPIMKAKAKRLAEETAEQREKERLEAIARAREAEQAAEEEKRKAEEAERLREQAEKSRRRANRFAGGAVLLALMALVLGVYAFRQKGIAEVVKEEAISAQMKADSSARIAIAARDSANRSANVALEQKKIADTKTDEAEKAKKEVQASLSKLTRSNENLVRLLLQNATVSRENGDYSEALNTIRLADAIDVLSSAVADAYLENTSACIQNGTDYAVALESIKYAFATGVLSPERRLAAYLNIADTCILNLQYDTALMAVRLALPDGGISKQVSTRYLDLSYWYGEIDELNKSRELLNNAYQAAGRRLPSGTLTDTVSLHRAMHSLDSVRYYFLQDRYYPTMVSVPGGTFDMGELDTTIEYSEGSRPVHRVTVSSFSMSATEVTVFQYSLFEPLKDIRQLMAGPNTGNHPVVNVSWYDAVEYANWLSDRKGRTAYYDIDKETKDVNNESEYDNLKWTVTPKKASQGYRLPTEAEWEYAARGGNRSNGHIYAGSDSLDLVGWYDQNSGRRTNPVGKKVPNELGLYDLSGNAWEWCWDWYDDYNPNPKENPPGAEKGSNRVLRGGSWLNDPEGCRAAYRYGCYPDRRDDFIGFRLVFVPQSVER